MKRVLLFALCLVEFGLVAQVIYQPHRRNSFRSKATAFQPSDVAGLVMWFDANSIGSPTNQNGYLVTNWYDKSVNAYIASQTGSAKQPYWTNNAGRLGGKPWLQFKSANDQLVGSTAFYAQTNTIFVVVSMDTMSAAAGIFCGTNASTRNQIGQITPTTNFGMYAGTILSGAAQSVVPGQWYLLEVTFASTGSSIYTNGVLHKSGNAGNQGTSGVILGNTTASSDGLLGGISEVLFYNTNVESTVDRPNIRSYFTTKYGPFANW